MNTPYENTARTGVQSKSQPKTTGHDTVLRALQNKGSLVTIVMLSGFELVGVLCARDKYTLTLVVDGVRRIIFKHAVEQFFGQESAPTDKAQ